jgi:DNA-binding LacI/PurR family transcriptional regulator
MGTTGDRPLGKRATIYDVAREAGVSAQTVSRFLKGYQGILPDTKARVVAALDNLGYQPNLTARSLITGRSHRLGALTHEVAEVGPSKILQGASAAARQAGYLLDIVALDMTDPAHINAALKLLRSQDLAGVLALSTTDEMTQAFGTADFPVPALIATEADFDTGGAPSSRFHEGMAGLVASLEEWGHQRFLHLAGPSNWSAARNRKRAFEAALAERSLESTGVVFGDWSAESGYRAISGLPHNFGATAVICANDQMALGALLALAERGLRVPDDISVTGIDDIPEAAYFSTPLTTLRIDFLAEGRLAVEQLLHTIGVRESEPAQPPNSTLITRKSIGPVRR